LLYDVHVTSRDKSNTYTYIYNEKKIVLTPTKPKHIPYNQRISMVTINFLKKVMSKGSCL